MIEFCFKVGDGDEILFYSKVRKELGFGVFLKIVSIKDSFHKYRGPYLAVDDIV